MSNYRTSLNILIELKLSFTSVHKKISIMQVSFCGRNVMTEMFIISHMEPDIPKIMEPDVSISALYRSSITLLFIVSLLCYCLIFYNKDKMKIAFTWCLSQ